MITPVIIKILFYVGIVLSIISGVVILIAGIFTAIDQGSVAPALGGLLGAPLAIVMGILISRVYAELLIVVFQIHENLVAIKNKLVDEN
jgi:hypothetical protein